MYLEIKALMTTIAILFIILCIPILLQVSILFTMLAFMGIGLFVFGDILIGYLITRNNLKPQLDPTPRGWEPCLLFTLTGNFDVVNTLKGPEGQRSFRYNNQNASVINKGDFQIRMKNGNSAFIGHESVDENINLKEVKYAETIGKEFETNDLKEIHAKILAEMEERFDVKKDTS